MTAISIDDYAPIVGDHEVEEIRELASRVQGMTIKHVNSTKFGGGVAEILKSIIPLANSIGLKATWLVMEGSEEFFGITKSFHNALQGQSLKLTESMKKIYLENNKVNAEKLDLEADIIHIHDPQPAAIIAFHKVEHAEWVWRCHIDLTNANQTLWQFLKRFVKKYDVLIFSLDRYVRDDVKDKRVMIRPPSIDPLSDKNKPLSMDEILSVLNRFDVDPERPILTQVGRFDPWKDPLGVIDVYRLVKRKIEGTQLLLIGSMAQDDPEGAEWHRRTVEKAGQDRDIHILTNLEGVGDIEVNAFQRASSVIVQKSIREGFGLTVTEALWKSVPVVATRAGGITLQVIDGITGYLAETSEDMAEKVIHLLRRPFLARMMGLEGREHVKRNFLITRQIKDYVKRLYLEILTKPA